jgi:hypothetical protein
MARATARTVAKVKSSAMIPRQPDVPNVMIPISRVHAFTR